MSNEKMGGPAFPVNTGNIHNSGAYEADPGMTLWDYYAAHAPAEGMNFHGPESASEATGIPVPEDTNDTLAMVEFAVAVKAWIDGRYADAMLAERAKRMETADGGIGE